MKMAISPTLRSDDGIVVFTDGSASYKDRSGGWGWIALDNFDTEVTGSGSESDTTVNRMELTAADSEYVVLGSRDPGRARRKNIDLWNELDEAIELHEYVEWNHVRGHTDSYYNDVADRLAGEARREGIS